MTGGKITETQSPKNNKRSENVFMLFGWLGLVVSVVLEFLGRFENFKVDAKAILGFVVLMIGDRGFKKVIPAIKKISIQKD